MAAVQEHRTAAEVIDLISSDDEHRPVSPGITPNTISTTLENATTGQDDEAVAGPSTNARTSPSPPLPHHFDDVFQDPNGPFAFDPNDQDVFATAEDREFDALAWLNITQQHMPPLLEQNGNASTQEAQPTQGPPVVTVEDCLEKVLEIFPDIDHDYVTGLWLGFDETGDYEILPGQARLDNIVEQLLANTAMDYPRRQKGKQSLKRKRQDSEEGLDMKRWERADREILWSHPNITPALMIKLVKAEFPIAPQRKIGEVFLRHRHLFQSYLAIAEGVDSSDGSWHTGRPLADPLASAEAMVRKTMCPALLDELYAARLRVAGIRNERAMVDARKQAEHENLQRAMEAGETAECQACFDELPMNRMIHCDGSTAHFTCFDCAETYIKSEVGSASCHVLCTAGCGSGFAYNQLQRLSNKPLLEKLAQLEQEKAIRDAGLQDLEECPFCDYKAIAPPVEEDFEFRCANPACEQVSCRRCKSQSHVPKSCEEHAKDNKLDSRHKIEEAMTAALVRSCNKCKKQFIKELGCNKMHCHSCGNLQCYVCSTDIKDYNHFEQNPRGHQQGAGKCPLYDNVEERHEREVKEAEAKAREEALKDNPNIATEDLEIRVSDAVKQQETARRQRAGPHGIGGVAAPFEIGAAQAERILQAHNRIRELQHRQQAYADQLHDRVRVAHPAHGGLALNRARVAPLHDLGPAGLEAVHQRLQAMEQALQARPLRPQRQAQQQAQQQARDLQLQQRNQQQLERMEAIMQQGQQRPQHPYRPGPLNYHPPQNLPPFMHNQPIINVPPPMAPFNQHLHAPPVAGAGPMNWMPANVFVGNPFDPNRAPQQLYMPAQPIPPRPVQPNGNGNVAQPLRDILFGQHEQHQNVQARLWQPAGMPQRPNMPQAAPVPPRGLDVPPMPHAQPAAPQAEVPQLDGGMNGAVAGREKYVEHPAELQEPRAPARNAEAEVEAQPAPAPGRAQIPAFEEFEPLDGVFRPGEDGFVLAWPDDDIMMAVDHDVGIGAANAADDLNAAAAAFDELNNAEQMFRNLR